MGSRRKPRCRARGAPRGRPRAGAGRGVTGDSRGPHLHVEQLGRLIHPDGDGALTQGFAEHFLEGIPHLIHPTREREQGGPVSPSLFGSIAAPSPGTATLPPAFVRRRAARLSANPKPPPRPVTPRTPRGREACEKPPHPPPRALPVPGAGRSHRLPAAGAARAGTVPSALCQGPEGLGRVGGHAPSVHRSL